MRVEFVYQNQNTNNTSHEWLVTSNFHPFHHHTWPFQLQNNILTGWFGEKK